MNILLIARMGVLTALGIVFSYMSAIPLFGAKLFPAQHALNVIAGVTIGPVPGAVVAVVITTIRIMLGTGTPLGYPGSIFGVILAGLLYRRFRSRIAAMAGEMLGTGLIGAVAAWPLAVLLLGNAKAAAAGVTFFIMPFALSSISGALIGGVVLALIERYVPAPWQNGSASR